MQVKKNLVKKKVVKKKSARLSMKKSAEKRSVVDVNRSGNVNVAEKNFMVDVGRSGNKVSEDTAEKNFMVDVNRSGNVDVAEKNFMVDVCRSGNKVFENTSGNKAFEDVDEVLAGKIVSRTRSNADERAASHYHIYNSDDCDDTKVYNNDARVNDRVKKTKSKIFIALGVVAVVFFIIKIFLCGGKKND